jgi:hypothetical protein
MIAPVLIGPTIAAQVIARCPGVRPMSIMNVATVALVAGDVGMLLLSPHISLVYLIVPMVLLGFGFGFPIGLVDGEAPAAVHERHSGTAAGVSNSMRLGSEAVVVGAYAAIITALLRSHIADSLVAQQTAAGAAGHASIYTDQFLMTLVPTAILTAVVAVAFNALHRTHREAVEMADRPLMPMPGGPQAAPADSAA